MAERDPLLETELRRLAPLPAVEPALSRHGARYRRARLRRGLTAGGVVATLLAGTAAGLGRLPEPERSVLAVGPTQVGSPDTSEGARRGPGRLGADGTKAPAVPSSIGGGSSDGEPSPSTSEPRSPLRTKPEATGTTGADSATRPDGEVDEVTTTSVGASTTVTIGAPATTPGVPSTGSTPTTGTTSTAAVPRESTTTTRVGEQERTFNLTGGTVVLAWDRSRIAVRSVVPASGFRVNREVQTTEVEIVFVNDLSGIESTLHLKLVAGELVVEE